jgi:hypothetical protein
MWCATSNRDVSTDGRRDVVLGDHVTGYAVSYEQLRPFHLGPHEYSEQKEGGSYELRVQVSRLTEQHGKVTEKIISRPRLKIVPGVPSPVPEWLNLPYYSGPMYFSGSTRGAEEERVTVNIAWEGEQSDVAVCTVTVWLREKIVSRTKMKVRAKEQ